MTVLEIKDLTKRYGPITAVDDLSLQVEKGNIYGLLGPNGSGKTTTLGAALGIILPDDGTFTWFEQFNGHEARLRVGALLETPNFYPFLNADDNLAIIAHIKGLKKPNFDEILDIVNLRSRRKSKFKTFSLGMKQRLAIAAALVGNPDVLILDEPTNGLDPQGIAEIRETIIQIGESGKTIIMASHILDEVEKVCTHVAILKRGRLLATGPVGRILSDDLFVEVAASDMQKLHTQVKTMPFVQKISVEDDKLILQISEGQSVSQLNQELFKQGIILHHLVAKKRSLESEFLEITKN